MPVKVRNFDLTKWLGPVVAALAFVFALALMPHHAHGAQLVDRIVAVVDGEAITWLELYETMERELGPRLKDMSPEEKKRALELTQNRALASLVEQRLIMQQARRRGIEVGEQDLQAAIESMKAKYNLDDKGLTEALKQEGVTLEEYKGILQEQITVSRIVDMEVRSKLADELSTPKEKPQRLYRLAQIFFPFTEGQELSGAQRMKLAKAQNRIEAGEPFGVVAEELSEAPGAPKSGDMGYLMEDALAREFKDVLAAMKPGQVSAPFKTAKGVHVIALGEVKDTSQAKAEELFEARYRQWARGLKEAATIDLRL